MLETWRLADPGAALEWANAISESRSRSYQLRRVLGEQPRAWARAALAELELSEEEFSELSKRISRGW